MRSKFNYTCPSLTSIPFYSEALADCVIAASYGEEGYAGAPMTEDIDHSYDY